MAKIDPLICCGSITSVQDFVSSVLTQKRRLDDDRIWYRGHSKPNDAEHEDDRYDLCPSIGRVQKYCGIKYHFLEDDNYKQESQILDRFRRLAYMQLNRMLSPWESLILARHYGLPTRILDWTASPLAALFFAARSNPRLDGVVWGFRHAKRTRHGDLRRYTLLIDHDLLDDPSHPLRNPLSIFPPTREGGDAVKVVYPVYNSPRIVAQDGAFTWHNRPHRPLDEYASKAVEFDDARLDIDKLLYWRVRGTSKARILQELDSLGVSRMALYPDLDGLSGDLIERIILWSQKDG